MGESVEEGAIKAIIKAINAELEKLDYKTLKAIYAFICKFV